MLQPGAGLGRAEKCYSMVSEPPLHVGMDWSPRIPNKESLWSAQVFLSQGRGLAVKKLAFGVFWPLG